MFGIPDAEGFEAFEEMEDFETPPGSTPSDTEPENPQEGLSPTDGITGGRIPKVTGSATLSAVAAVGSSDFVKHPPQTPPKVARKSVETLDDLTKLEKIDEVTGAAEEIKKKAQSELEKIQEEAENFKNDELKAELEVAEEVKKEVVEEAGKVSFAHGHSATSAYNTSFDHSEGTPSHTFTTL